MEIAKILSISKNEKLDFIGALKWSIISIFYVSILFFLYHILAKIFGTGKVVYKDDLNVAKHFISTFIMGVIISPVLETFFVLFFYKLLNKLKLSYFITWLLITLIFSLTHLTRNWAVVFMVAIIFQIQQYYLSIRVKHTNFNAVWLEGTIIHFAHNLVSYLFAYYKMQPT